MTLLQELPRTRRKRRWSAAGFGWLWFSSAAIALMAVLPYLTMSLAGLAAEDSGLAKHYSTKPAWVQAALYAHMVPAGFALFFSPAQLSAGMRSRFRKGHRRIGRVVLVCIAVAGVMGLVLAPSSYAGWIGTAGFGMLAAGWLASAWIAFSAIRGGDVQRHRAWMMRTFALTYAGVTLRLWVGLLIAVQATFGVDATTGFDRAYQLVPFLSWVPNLLIAELLIRRTRASVPVRPQSSVLPAGR